MAGLLGVKWGPVFDPQVPVFETITRGTIVYLGLFFVLRFILKRESGSVGTTDLLVLVLVADAAQNGMAGNYSSVPDGLLLVATILFWSFALNWISFRSARLRPLIEPPPLPLVRDGELLWRNMRRELITEEDLRSQARLQGIEDLADVRHAYMEGDGRISIVAPQGRGVGDPRGQGADG